MNNINKPNNKYNDLLLNQCETFASNYLNVIEKKKDPDDLSLLANSDNTFKFYIGEIIEMTFNLFC